MTEHHDYSSAHFEMPDWLQVKLRELADVIPRKDLDAKGTEDCFHITCKYGILQYKPQYLREAVRGFGPCRVTLGRTALFEQPEKGREVLVIEVLGQPVHDLHSLICRLPHIDNFDIFRPHITVAYMRPGIGAKYAGQPIFEGTELILSDLIYISPAGRRSKLDLSLLASEKSLIDKAGFREDEARDEDGKWTDSGGAVTPGEKELRERDNKGSGDHGGPSFRGTKVADSSGTPIAVFHGTTQSDIEFDDRDTFFASHEDDAEVHGKAVPVYLNLQNPRVVHTEYDPTDWLDGTDHEDIAKAHKDGNDGVIVYGKDSRATYVVFSAGQIKKIADPSGALENPHEPATSQGGEQRSTHLNAAADARLPAKPSQNPDSKGSEQSGLHSKIAQQAVNEQRSMWTIAKEHGLDLSTDHAARDTIASKIEQAKPQSAATPALDAVKQRLAEKQSAMVHGQANAMSESLQAGAANSSNLTASAIKDIYTNFKDHSHQEIEQKVKDHLGKLPAAAVAGIYKQVFGNPSPEKTRKGVIDATVRRIQGMKEMTERVSEINRKSLELDEQRHSFVEIIKSWYLDDREIDHLNEFLKANPDWASQPRGPDGRWTSGGGGSKDMAVQPRSSGPKQSPKTPKAASQRQSGSGGNKPAKSPRDTSSTSMSPKGTTKPPKAQGGSVAKPVAVNAEQQVAAKVKEAKDYQARASMSLKQAGFKDDAKLVASGKVPRDQQAKKIAADHLKDGSDWLKKTVGPALGVAQAPHELTKKQFSQQYWFHGKNPENSGFDSPEIRGGVAKDHRLAADYTGLYSGTQGGKIHVVHESEIPDKARQRESKHGQFGAVIDSMLDTPIQSRGVTLPADVLDPHRSLVEAAIGRGESVPSHVLDEYPDLAGKNSSPSKMSMVHGEGDRLSKILTAGAAKMPDIGRPPQDFKPQSTHTQGMLAIGGTFSRAPHGGIRAEHPSDVPGTHNEVTTLRSKEGFQVIETGKKNGVAFKRIHGNAMSSADSKELAAKIKMAQHEHKGSQAPGTTKSQTPAMREIKHNPAVVAMSPASRIAKAHELLASMQDVAHADNIHAFAEHVSHMSDQEAAQFGKETGLRGKTGATLAKEANIASQSRSRWQQKCRQAGISVAHFKQQSAQIRDVHNEGVADFNLMIDSLGGADAVARARALASSGKDHQGASNALPANLSEIVGQNAEYFRGGIDYDATYEQNYDRKDADFEEMAWNYLKDGKKPYMTKEESFVKAFEAIRGDQEQGNYRRVLARGQKRGDADESFSGKKVKEVADSSIPF